MRFRSTSLRCAIGLFALPVLALHAVGSKAVVFDSGPIHVAIPATITGLTLNLLTGGTTSIWWDFNPYANAGGSLNFRTSSRASVAAMNNDPQVLGEAELIGPLSTFGTDAALLAAQFRAGGLHTVGVRFYNEDSAITNYGYVEIETTQPTGFPAKVVRYTYESSGAAIAVSGDSLIFSDDFEPVVILADCSASVVQTALNTAPDGSTIRLPPKDCDWGTSKVKRAAGITLVGAGRNATTIRRSALVTELGTYLLEFDCSNGKTVELSGISFVGNDGSPQSETQRNDDFDAGVLLSNGCIDFKIHDATFSKFSDAGLSIIGRPQRGVVYRDDFISNFKCQPGGNGSCFGYGVVVYGNYGETVWSPLALGTRDAVFVEDNYFRDDRHDIASNYGGSYVARHNTIVATQRTRDYGRMDAHGLSDGETGSRSWEIYRNTVLTEPRSMVADGIATRGGDGVVFENRLLNIPYSIVLSNENCSGTYPLAYQTREAYIWDNDRTPIPGYYPDAIWIASGCSSYLKLNRDYFTHPRPNYVPYTYPHPLR